HYVDAHTLKALQLVDTKQYSEAITHLEAALLYPENLEVGKPTHDEKNALIYYYMGKAYDQMGNTQKAKESYQKSAGSRNGPGMHDLIYYQAKALQKLGQNEAANEMFNNLITQGQDQRKKGTDNILVAVEEASSFNNKAISNSYYLEALGNEGLGNKEESQNLFESALKEYKNNLWAKRMINN
ncbi:MAG: tetratricopeptide repeat protein, partial [Cyclobacteriaceae bacterium]